MTPGELNASVGYMRIRKSRFRKLKGVGKGNEVQVVIYYCFKTKRMLENGD